MEGSEEGKGVDQENIWRMEGRIIEFVGWCT